MRGWCWRDLMCTYKRGGRMEDPILALMKEYGVELTRENYLRWQYLGQYGDPPAELTAEEEAELPRQFRSNYEEDEDDEEDEAEANPEVKANTDPVHTDRKSVV